MKAEPTLEERIAEMQAYSERRHRRKGILILALLVYAIIGLIKRLE